jgi:hypothetical protein
MAPLSFSTSASLPSCPLQSVMLLKARIGSSNFSTSAPPARHCFSLSATPRM